MDSECYDIGRILLVLVPAKRTREDIGVTECLHQQVIYYLLHI